MILFLGSIFSKDKIKVKDSKCYIVPLEWNLLREFELYSWLTIGSTAFFSASFKCGLSWISWNLICFVNLFGSQNQDSMGYSLHQYLRFLTRFPSAFFSWDASLRSWSLLFRSVARTFAPSIVGINFQRFLLADSGYGSHFSSCGRWAIT